MTAERISALPVAPVEHRTLVWYLICRTGVITLVLGGAAFFYLKGNLDRAVVPLFFMVAISYVEALATALVASRVHRFGLLNQVQIVWDLLFVTLLILLTGAVESVFSFFYLLVIVAASFLLSRRLTILAAASSAILFGGVLVLQFYGLLLPLGVEKKLADATYFISVFVHIIAFFLTALLSGTLADRWRHSEALLTRKRIDYAELEKMNRTILAHISSGVMLIDPQGRIRSFNRAACDITGLSLEEVYDRPAQELFPDLTRHFAALRSQMDRGEGTYTRPTGERQALGFATTTARGGDGQDIGTLVTFQDLTQFKQIEDQLRQADRLAAIGRLSAALAHEIRNPLASISGSAELLREAGNLPDEEHRLLGIVVRETERLNGLLGSFLNFARPSETVRTTFDLAELLDELHQMLLHDQRFARVKVSLRTPRPCPVTLDREQFCQVLWDLCINAAEALDGAGDLVIRVKNADELTVVVEDSGPGVSEQVRKQIFEPFFSTKPKGTGLGLATVHAIIVAHGGTIAVDRSPLGGARFTLTFPD